MLQSPMGEQIEQVVWLEFSMSNNDVEYEAILVGLNLALALTATKVEGRSDSQLVVGQIQREYEARDECMARYLAPVDAQMKKVEEWLIWRVHWEKNGWVDALAEVATTLPIQETTMLPIYLQVSFSISHEQVNDIV